MRLMTARGAFPLGAALAAAGVVAAVAVGLLHLDRLPITLCLFKQMTGLPCATCGSTRAFAYLYQLDPAGAFRLNPFAALGALGIALWGLADLALLTGGRVLALDVTPGESKGLAWGVLLALAVNWAYVLAAGQ
jgi:hypothetical protein